MDFEFAQWDVRLRVSLIKPCCRQMKERVSPHGAGLQTVSVPLHLAAFGVFEAKLLRRLNQKG